MKLHLYLFSLLVVFSPLKKATAQTKHELLSIQNLGGNGYDGLIGGGYWSNGLKGTSDGGFVMTIYSKSTVGNIDLSCNAWGSYVHVYRKYDSLGNLEWQRCNNGFYEVPYLLPLPSGNVIYFGSSTTSIRNGLVFMQKQNQSGGVMLSKELGSISHEKLLDVLPTDDGNFVLAATTTSPGQGDVIYTPADIPKKNRNIWLLKIDTNLQVLWTKIIGGSGIDYGAFMAHAPGGGFYILSDSKSDDYDCKCNGQTNDVYIARLNKDGEIIWSRCMGGTDGSVNIKSITEDGSGGVYILSSANSGGRDLSGIYLGGDDMWVVQLDSNNNRLLNKCYGTVSGDEQPRTIKRSADGTVWVTGTTNTKGQDVDTAFGGGDVWVFNIDKQGKILYSKVLGTDQKETVSGLFPLADSTMMLVGTFTKPGTDSTQFPIVNLGEEDVFMARFGHPKANSVSEHIAGLTDITVYPNPVQYTLHITTENDYTATVCNTAGINIYNQYLKAGNHEVDMSSWATGVYLLKVQDKAGQTYYKKLVKM